MIPTKEQWQKWSLPSKLTAIGAYVGILGLFLTVIFFFVPYVSHTDSSKIEEDLTVAELESRIDSILTRLKSTEQSDLLIAILEYRAERNRKILAQYEQADEFLKEFNELHEIVIAALKDGNLVLAHEVTATIHKLPLKYSSVLRPESEFKYIDFAYLPKDFVPTRLVSQLRERANAILNMFVVCVKVIDIETNTPIKGAMVELNEITERHVKTKDEIIDAPNVPIKLYGSRLIATTQTDGTVYFALPLNNLITKNPSRRRFVASATAPEFSLGHIVLSDYLRKSARQVHILVKEDAIVLYPEEVVNRRPDELAVVKLSKLKL